MSEPSSSPPPNEDPEIERDFESISHGFLLIDITGFLSVIRTFYNAANKEVKKKQIEQLLNGYDWFEHYSDKKLGTRVLSEAGTIEHEHEKHSAILLAKANYTVIFAPKGLFRREEKKFDVFLIRGTVMLRADLKCITTKNPDTIAKRIKEGSDQASRVVVDVQSDIEIKALIDGLRSGSVKNSLLKEIFLFYRNKLYILPKNLILSERIYKLLK